MKIENPFLSELMKFLMLLGKFYFHGAEWLFHKRSIHLKWNISHRPKKQLQAHLAWWSDKALGWLGEWHHQEAHSSRKRTQGALSLYPLCSSQAAPPWESLLPPVTVDCCDALPSTLDSRDHLGVLWVLFHLTWESASSRGSHNMLHGIHYCMVLDLFTFFYFMWV